MKGWYGGQKAHGLYGAHIGAILFSCKHGVSDDIVQNQEGQERNGNLFNSESEGHIIERHFDKIGRVLNL